MIVIATGYTWDRRAGVAPALLTAWRVARRLKNACARYKHPAWVLDYAVNNCGAYRVGSASHDWQVRLPRTAHLYAPETTYWEDHSGLRRSICHSAHLTFLGGEAAGLGTLIDERARYARFVDPDGILGDLIEEIAVEGSDRMEAGFWMAQGRFNQVIDLLLGATNRHNETREIAPSLSVASLSPFVRAVDNYLAARLAQKVTLSALANHLHISVSSLSHRYRAEAGETTMARLIRMRINLAKGMLLKGQPLKVIALAAGFSDAYHLSKTFKNLEGLSPRSFLERLRGA